MDYSIVKDKIKNLRGVKDNLSEVEVGDIKVYLDYLVKDNRMNDLYKQFDLLFAYMTPHTGSVNRDPSFWKLLKDNYYTELLGMRSWVEEPEVIIPTILPIVRQLKIDLIADNTNEIITWFNNLWSGLISVELNTYHKNGGEILYYNFKEDDSYEDKTQCIFFHDVNKGRFYYDCNNFENILRFKFGIGNESDIIEVAKALVENVLNQEIPMPMCQLFDTCSSRVENVLRVMQGLEPI